MLDYVISLREGIMDAWAGILIAMRAGDKSKFHGQLLGTLSPLEID